MSRSRLTKIPLELKAAVAEARKATGACLAMCGAVALTETLAPMEHEDTRSWIEKLFDIYPDGPSELELLIMRQQATLKALARCRRLSVEGVKISLDARYVVLRAVAWAAERSCRCCRPKPGQKTCPAMQFLEKLIVEE